MSITNIVKIVRLLDKQVDMNSVDIIMDYYNDVINLDNSYVYKFKKYLLERYNNNWNQISAHKYLSENFMEEFSENLNWEFIVKYQKLSETLIEKYQHLINW